ncbi:MAG: UDP-N-acetylmuramoyl-L-alanine--D-glutamate ligase [Actinomycetota bacterium]
MTDRPATGDDVDLSAPLVVGFGVVGRALTAALTARGIQPVVIEDRPSDASREAAAASGIDMVEAPESADLDARIGQASVLLPSPGVPDHHPAFASAATFGLPVRSEFDLARMWDDRPLVAITGTNGKTTVTTMVTDALDRSGIAAVAVGNTEVPLVTAIDDASIEVFVVEASSFRLGHSACFSPKVATWLNLAPDHLDAHASYEAYVEAKAAIWANLPPDGLAVANAADPVVMAHLPSDRRVERFALDPSLRAEWTCRNGTVVGPDGPVVTVDELVRSQPHDIENALAVAATASAAGATGEGIARALAAFSGLPHRVELVGEWGGIRWFNDSKATVPQATEAAIGGFESVVLLAGGRNKGLALDGLRNTVPPVRHVVAMGDASAEVAEVFEGLVPVTAASSMEDAIAMADHAAQTGDVVLLSPGCTSFDWYPNYVERGLDFTRLVRRLAQDKVGRP